MQAEGKVVSLQGELAEVSVLRAGACGRCSEAGGCGASNRCDTYLLPNPSAIGPGERVGLDVPDGAAWRAAMLAYGFPLAGVFLGAFVGKVLGLGDLGLFVACLAGGATMWVVAGMAARAAWFRTPQPRIVRILSE